MSITRTAAIASLATCTAAAVGLLAPPVSAVAPSAEPPPVTLTVTSLSDSGAGSLRSAITSANTAAAGTPQTITFAVNGEITLASNLPAIGRTVTITGATAPTYGAGGAPVVGINANSHAGLTFGAGAGGSQLLALAVYRANSHGVTLKGDDITLNNNYIGLNLTGQRAGNAGAGVYVSDQSSDNTIGANASQVSGTVANVISANRSNGIALDGSDGNTVVANRIGTDPAGQADFGNGKNGISIYGGANDNTVGGTVFVNAATGQANDPTGDKGTAAPTFVVPPLGNLVSGNQGNGVYVGSDSRNNVLNGNFVGTTAGGNSGLGNVGDGVKINNADHNSLTGCQFSNNPFVYYNVLSGNGGNGLHIDDSDDITVQANFFGIGANNTDVVANQRNGILVDGSSQNTQVGGVIPLGNVSAGNVRSGIYVKDTVSGFITFNTFGGLLAFKGAAPNGRDGLLIRSTGGDNLARTNVFSGNDGNGIEIAGKATGVTVDPNIIGLTTKGDDELANGGEGILITDEAHHNVIGGTRRSVIPQNTISGNDGYGIVLDDHSYANTVKRSFIGTEVLGVSAIANDGGGVLLAGHTRNNKIGTKNGSRPVNLVSGNGGPGVKLRSKTSDNSVRRNYIGLNRRGRSLPNGGSAIVDNGNRTKISGNKTN